MWRLGMLASHRGSNVEAVIEACERGELPCTPAVVVSNNADAQVLQIARDHRVPAVHVGGSAVADPASRDRAIVDHLRAHAVDLVLLLGYLKKLGPETLRAYPGRVLNIHPALLPKYGGVGMWGIHVHRAVIAAGEKETGVSIHVVDEVYDHGEVIARAVVPVREGDTPETLEVRVVERGRDFLVETLKRIATGAVKLP